jgi:putative phosphoesterase
MSWLRVVVVADTHLRGDGRAGPDGLRRLPPAARGELDQADVILHAGDVLDQTTLDAFADLAPTYAVLGNNDRDLTAVLPPTRRLELAGVPVAMIHDSGPGAGRAARMHRRFPDAAVVIFGHSHRPVDEEGIDGQRLFNPGSPTQRRAEPRHTVGVLELADGKVVAHRIVPVDEPATLRAIAPR